MRLCYISAKFAPHPIVFPLRSLRGRCRLRQMRCNYIRAVGATLLQYVSVLPELKSIAVGNGAKLSNALPGCVAVTVYSIVPNRATRDMRIRRCVNAPLKNWRNVVKDFSAEVVECGTSRWYNIAAKWVQFWAKWGNIVSKLPRFQHICAKQKKVLLGKTCN